MKRGGPLRNRGRSRFEHQRDRNYTAWVRDFGCLMRHYAGDCLGATEAAHVTRTRAVGEPDRACVVPLCRKHHGEQEGKTAEFEQRYKLPEGYLAQHAAALYEIYRGR